MTALKKSVERLYNKNRVHFDAVCVCSAQEKKIFTAHFNYDASQVYITGFPRHDALYSRHKETGGGECILVFPTWRKGFEKIDSSSVRETGFVKEWTAVLDASLRVDAYIDIGTKLPGAVSFTCSELVENIKTLEAAGWVQTQSDLQKYYFEHVDAKNSERVAKVIKGLALL